MSRRRYLSTKISTDPRVNRLAMDYGDFAVLFYTWAIPHAADDASLPDDPEELLFMLFPGRRDKTTEDVMDAITGAVHLGLLERRGDHLFFPTSFYTYQTYIKSRAPQISATPKVISEPAANQRNSAQISAIPRKTPSPLDSCLDSMPSGMSARAHEDVPAAAPPLDYKAELKQDQEGWTDDEIAAVDKQLARRSHLPIITDPAGYRRPLLAEYRAKHNGAKPSSEPERPKRKPLVHYPPGESPLGLTYEESRQTS